MALSQIQCLDDNHVNPRNHESKPDFLYCEDQRLALEVLLQDGREAFFKFLEARGLRGFLSDPELETLVGTVEPYDPGSELYLEGAEDDEPPLSLRYWPDLSDMSVPQMDLGWPDCDAYRGVTRTTMYSQPPLDGQPHIKEIVRKMIAQAQKVIAVVMDVFTDVDIFRDLLDAGFKRKISVYILLERTTLPHFLSMCQRANMHAGHLKHLRVRCTEGLEFYSRSSTKVRGRLGHRFMFIDGDKAVSGSYSFTWMSSRLERNLVTVVTGQAVKAFDSLFRFLYATSSLADLRQVSMDAEPEPEPIPQPAAVAPPSAALARKLYNPKYALVALGNPSPSPPPEPTKDTPDPEVPDTKRRRRRRASKEAIEEGPPVHPGLLNLEKACLISYLPTWPEPDPASDVIGFINIRDSKKPTQVHLQRSEMFETSQAIRFRSPFTGPERTLPEVAQPRQQTAKHEEMNKLRPVQDKTKAQESEVDKAQPTRLESKPEAPKQNSPASQPKSGSDKDKTLNTGNKLPSNTSTYHDASHQSSSKVSPPNITRPSHPTQTITTNNPKPDSLPGSNTKTETSLNTQRNAAVYKTHTLESYSTQTAHLHGPTDSNTQTKTVLPHTDSHTQTQNSTEMTPNCQTPPLNSHVSPSSTSTSVSQNNQISVTASTTTPACAPSSSVSSSSAALSPPLPSSSAPPVPKPRTIQLVIRDGVTSDRQKLPDVNVVRTFEASTGRIVVHNEPAAVATVVQTSPEKGPETVPDQQNKTQKDAENSGNVGDAPQQKPTSQETKKEEAVGLRDDRAGVRLVAGTNLKAQSHVLITDAPKEESVNIVEKIPKDVESKILTSIDSKLTPQMETKAPEKTPTDCEFAEVPNEISKDVTQRRTYHARAHELQRISYCESTPQDIGVLETVDSSKPPTPTQVSPTHTSVSSAGDSTLSPKARASTHTPDKSLRLHFPDTPDLRSPTPERESRTLTALIRTPTPDGFLPRTPTPDSRTHTPDFRTPTSDVSDGYVSAVSTASEDYYECSDSPSHEPVFDRAAYRNHGTTEDHVSLTHTNTPNATTTTPTSPAYINDDTPAATSGATDTNTSNSETQSLSGSASASSLSSLLEKKVEEETSNEENGREEDEKGKEVNAEERRSSEEAKRTADHFNQGKDSTEMVEKNKEAQPQAPKRKRVQSAAERLVDRGGTPEESASKGAEPKRFSTGDLKPKKVSAAGERPDKDKAVNRAASVPGSMERRDRPSSARESEGQKVLCTPPRPRRGQQQDSRASSPSRPSKPSRSLSATQSSLARPGGSRQLNQAESKALHSSFQGLDNTSSARRLPARPPPAAAGAVGSAAARKPTEVLRQPPAAQGKARPGQSLNQHPYPKPQASFLHTHSTLQSRVLPHSQNQTASAQQAHSQEEGKAPFSLTFGRLYSLKGLKDKMSKLPVQSSRGSTSSPVQGRKSKS